MRTEHRACRCGRPAEWVYCPGMDAPLVIACTACVTEEYGHVPEWAERYTPADNKRIDQWNENLRRGWGPAPHNND
jgi:hypothetical protein